MSDVKLSILTPSYNQGRFIEKTILSVMNQDYDNIEHIIIDGGSTDNTLEILKKYPHLKWISEKDKGQSDSLNKGLEMANGEIIGWINSDDYYEPNVFNEVIHQFEQYDCDWLVGRLYVEYLKMNLKVAKRSNRICYEGLMNQNSSMTSQSAFYKSTIVKEVGGFDVENHMSMDYDLWVKLCKISEPLQIDKFLATFLRYPEQKTNSRNVFKSLSCKKRIFSREYGKGWYLNWKLRKNYFGLIISILKNILIYTKILDEHYAARPIFIKNNNEPG